MSNGWMNKVEHVQWYVTDVLHLPRLPISVLAKLTTRELADLWSWLQQLREIQLQKEKEGERRAAGGG